jgi:hypothetical protein
MENVIQSKVIGGDIRITSTPSGLWIEVLDGDVEPVRLDREQLACFGLQFKESAGGGRADEPAWEEIYRLSSRTR